MRLQYAKRMSMRGHYGDTYRACYCKGNEISRYFIYCEQ